MERGGELVGLNHFLWLHYADEFDLHLDYLDPPSAEEYVYFYLIFNLVFYIVILSVVPVINYSQTGWANLRRLLLDSLFCTST